MTRFRAGGVRARRGGIQVTAAGAAQKSSRARSGEGHLRGVARRNRLEGRGVVVYVNPRLHEHVRYDTPEELAPATRSALRGRRAGMLEYGRRRVAGEASPPSRVQGAAQGRTLVELEARSRPRTSRESTTSPPPSATRRAQQAKRRCGRRGERERARKEREVAKINDALVARSRARRNEDGARSFCAARPAQETSAAASRANPTSSPALTASCSASARSRILPWSRTPRAFQNLQELRPALNEVDTLAWELRPAALTTSDARAYRTTWSVGRASARPRLTFTARARRRACPRTPRRRSTASCRRRYTVARHARAARSVSSWGEVTLRIVEDDGRVVKSRNDGRRRGQRRALGMRERWRSRAGRAQHRVHPRGHDRLRCRAVSPGDV